MDEQEEDEAANFCRAIALTIAPPPKRLPNGNLLLRRRRRLTLNWHARSSYPLAVAVAAAVVYEDSLEWALAHSLEWPAPSLAPAPAASPVRRSSPARARLERSAEWIDGEREREAMDREIEIGRQSQHFIIIGALVQAKFESPLYLSLAILR